MKPHKGKPQQGSEVSASAKTGGGKLDLVAQASLESFPASDAPGWIGRYVDGADARIAQHLPAPPRQVKAGNVPGMPHGQVTIEDNSFVVDVALLARLFDMSAPDIQRLMRDGHMTSVCERGVDDHQGQYRLVFVHGERRAHINIDATGHVLARSITSRM